MLFYAFHVSVAHFRGVKWDLFLLKQKKRKRAKKRKPVIHGLGGWLARPSRHFVILEDSENGKVQKVSPKGIDLQRETAKRTKWTSRKWPRTLRLSVKMMITDEFCSPRQSPFVNAFGADFLHFTIFAILRNDEMTAWAGRPAGPELS